MVLPDIKITEEKIFKDAIELGKEMGLKITFFEVEEQKNDFDYKITDFICRAFLVLVFIFLINQIV